MGVFYQFNEISEGLYRITSPENVFMDLFVGSDKALLFDTGYGIGDLKTEIKKITELPLIIVNSHGHLDHTNGNYRFSEDIYIHEKDIELCKLHNGLEWRKKALDGAKNTENFITHEVTNILPEDFNEEKFINQGTGNLVTIKDGDVFDLGNMNLLVIEFPGHTAGSIGLLLEEKGILYVGDAMNPFVWLFGDEAEKLEIYIRSLYKAKSMDFESMYFGHMPMSAGKIILDDFIDCAENIEFEKGIPFNAFGSPEPVGRICSRKGYGPMEFGRPGFASVVINEDHLK